MILTLLKKIATRVFVVVLLVVLGFSSVPSFIFAQTSEGLSLSVTPTLFQMSAVPSQAWESGIKVINNNRQPITVYAQVVNFAPQGETGEGKFLPILEKSTEGSTLAEWVTISSEPIVVDAEKSYTFPFNINVPADASPGGHFAAIMIGTKPPESDGLVRVATSQVVTSLLFVRVAGDVVENGVVREFRVVNSFVDVPKADFEVRFENKGNVHIQPQGEILITNMWGKERGVIPINQQTHFGNVLPESIRKFEFSWSGEKSFSDIGRYKAVLSLAYGGESKKFVTSTAYFFVVPIKTGLIVLGVLLAFGFFVSWSVKMYIRRMLSLAGVDTQYAQAVSQQKSFMREGDVRIQKRVSMKAPVHSGVLDLKKRLENVKALTDKFKTCLHFVVAYKIFFGSVLLFIIAISTFGFFIKQATTEHRDYEITIDNKDTQITLSSEDIIYTKTQEQQNDPISATSTTVITPQKEQAYELILINSSDTPGLAASLQTVLEDKGYTVSDLQSDFEKSKERTVVVYDISLQEEALSLSKELNNALLSANPESSSTTPSISVYIGNDHQIQ